MEFVHLRFTFGPGADQLQQRTRTLAIDRGRGGRIADSTTVDRDTLTQVSTIEVLLAGSYFHWTNIGEIPRYGDFGLGTFTHLDGEMVQVGNTIYQVKADGSVHEPGGDLGTPFFATTFFDADHTLEIPGGVDFPGLQQQLKVGLPSPHYIYAVRIQGSFEYLKTRSVPAQEQPYPTLATVAATQPTFEFNDIEGTLVGFYFPQAFAGLNVPGFHFHFVTADRSGGGHVLELQASGLQAELDETARFELLLPEADAFRDFSLNSVTEGSLEEAEQ